MGDLYVDGEMLDRTRHDLMHIVKVLKKPGEEMEQLDGSDMGVEKLASRMDDFGDEWSYGIKQLTKFSDRAADALLEIKKSFAGLDEDLAQALREGGKSGGSKSA
ncbi:hypothetical protein O7599_18035 [Streptomyces sp. WMMC500]|uniref:hypothetical protein n=1 Tax=Streptomyces sp. WMMC500 TaxID=3015154 RepID=UPI00248BEF4A|nr:hypothetical protein [Streptomyces sp. WMMC500]WBB64291.1 hypothetical protein O7599_18035 [Streptomyces sp. WMMC500]